jgi:Zeta toxin
MIRRSMIPEVEGLSPMEATGLAHEEASHIAKRLAERVQSQGKNVIWDITMSSDSSTEGRIDLLRAAGYSRIDGIFVDIPVNVSLHRADARHRKDHDAYLNGHGFGGRYIQDELILAQAHPDLGSRNSENFERLRTRFDAWWRYDNSVDGRSAILIHAQLSDHDGDKERSS